MSENNLCRYKLVSRIDKKTLTGKTDYRDRFFYRILDSVSGKIATFDGVTVKKEMSNGTKIDGLELTADGRLMLKNIASAKTVITPSATKVGKLNKNTSQCVDFSLATLSIGNELCRNSVFMGAKTLRIQNCGYGTIDNTAKKAKMLGGAVYEFNNQKIVVMRNSDTITMLAEKWVYSNKCDGTRYMNGTFGALAEALGVENIEINGIEFITSSLESCFKAFRGKLKNIKIINSDMTYIKNMNELCSGLKLHKIEIIGTNFNNVTSMNMAFHAGSYLGNLCEEPMVIDIPKTPKLTEAEYLFGGYSRKSQPDMRFLEGTKLKNVRSMFYCSRLEYIDLKLLDLSECTNMDSMFYGCKELKSVDFGDQKITKLETANSMFSRCESLEYLDIMCIDSPKLRRSDEDFLPRSKQQRTQDIFKGVNRRVKVRMSKELLDIIHSNTGIQSSK